MKKLISLLFIIFAVQAMSAQTFGNSLTVNADDDSVKFVLYVSGKKINQEPAASVSVYPVYAEDIKVKITVADKVLEKTIDLSPATKNSMQLPYKAVYKLITDKEKLSLKLVLMTENNI